MEFRFLGNSGLKVSAISYGNQVHMAHKSRSM
jgi:aryl-alcohol dehydrogenase-like predicted oxidoreductase